MSDLAGLDPEPASRTLHPIVFHRQRFTIYLVTSAALGLAIAGVVALSGDLSLVAAVVTITPTTIVFAFVGLAAWYPCKTLPIGPTPPGRIVATHLVGALVASGMWMLIWTGWMFVASRLPMVGRDDLAASKRPLLVAIGALLYLMSVATHYLVDAFEASRASERAALEYRVLAREAELRAFKAQIDPHFLFNALNSISALCGSSPADARRMTGLLADFFRSSIRLGREDSISLGRELDLIETYLEIEKVRFGERLTATIDADDITRKTPVPPLILQPLVENAVRHGIAGLPVGGTVRIAAACGAGETRVVVENDTDPDDEDRRGEGIGLENVRGRLASVWGSRASMAIETTGHTYRVTIAIPFEAPRNETEEESR